jgi:5-oxoprolinase (ATP-hydrolysing)
MFYFSGISSLAVALMHSYTFDEHELKVAEIAKSVGFKNVSLSSQIMPMVRLVPRGFTASVLNKLFTLLIVRSFLLIV